MTLSFTMPMITKATALNRFSVVAMTTFNAKAFKAFSKIKGQWAFGICEMLRKNEKMAPEGKDCSKFHSLEGFNMIQLGFKSYCESCPWWVILTVTV